MIRRWNHGHSIGVGFLGALFLAQNGWLIYLAGLLTGIAVTMTLVLLRNGLKRTAAIGDGLTAKLNADAALALTEADREHERQVGLRQGEIAGVRAAARVEARDQHRRGAMREAVDRFGSDLRHDSLDRALQGRM